jgi:hypothetical protein
MTPILENQPVCYESDVDELMRIAAEQLAGDFTTRVHYIFDNPDLTDRADVQISAGCGYPDEARANLRAQFQAGRVCMGGRLMFSYDVPWRVFKFPAYYAALEAKHKNQSAGGDGK